MGKGEPEHIGHAPCTHREYRNTVCIVPAVQKNLGRFCGTLCRARFAAVVSSHSVLSSHFVITADSRVYNTVVSSLLRQREQRFWLWAHSQLSQHQCLAGYPPHCCDCKSGINWRHSAFGAQRPFSHRTREVVGGVWRHERARRCDFQ